MRALVVLTVVLAGITNAWSQDSSEVRAEKVPLKVYSGGFSAGGMIPINQELDNQSNALLKLSFNNTVYFQGPARFFFDVNWFGPGRNFGADAGFDMVASSGKMGAFVGVGIGAHHFDKGGYAFGENFGPSATVHVGMEFDLTDQVQVRFRAPYHVVVNETRDQTIGFELGVLFSSRFKKINRLVL